MEKKTPLSTCAYFLKNKKLPGFAWQFFMY